MSIIETLSNCANGAMDKILEKQQAIIDAQTAAEWRRIDATAGRRLAQSIKMFYRPSGGHAEHIDTGYSHTAGNTSADTTGIGQ